MTREHNKRLAGLVPNWLQEFEKEAGYMKEFKLEPGDVLVNINDHSDPFSVVKRWAIGPYDHVFLYLGRLFLGDYLSNGTPMLFESNGRGVIIQSLSNRYGEKVVVMRVKENWVETKIPTIIDEAVKLASEPQAYYDYLCIIRFVLPRLICEKLRLPMPLKWQRDPLFICSEAIYEVFIRAGMEDILVKNWDNLPLVPLPEDFVTDSVLLEEIGRVVLTEGVV